MVEYFSGVHKMVYLMLTPLKLRIFNWALLRPSYRERAFFYSPLMWIQQTLVSDLADHHIAS